jgi:phospholipid/cholesterol/gamma-HCH transport system substrate-binding protein
MNKRFVTFFLGVFTVVFLIELMFIKRNTKGGNFYDLYASFNKIDGVNPGDKIMVSGINVGYVEEIVLKKNYPLIKMKIAKYLNISDDSSVSIQTDGLFGSKFLMIEMGGTNKFMKNGDYFSFTEDSILIQDLLENIIKIGEKKKI